MAWGRSSSRCLTGEPPVEGETIEEVLDRVRRGAIRSPRSLNPNIPRALEAVCLKALAPKPGDRYPTALALAEEVEHWLADEPVTAWREPGIEHARRWARRHRTMMTATAAALLVAIVGLSALLAREKQSREREGARFDLAMVAIKTFHTGVSEDFLLKQGTFQELRTKLLLGASEFYQKLEEELKGQTDARSRAALGEAYFELGELMDKIGSREEALASFDRARATRQKLVDAYPAVAEYRLGLTYSLDRGGHLCEQTGQTARAVEAYQGALAILEEVTKSGSPNTKFQSHMAHMLNHIGVLQSQTGRQSEALHSYERAMAIRQKLADDYPADSAFQRELVTSHNSMAILQHETNHSVEALRLVRAGAGDPAAADRGQPCGLSVPKRPGGHPSEHRHPELGDRPSRGALHSYEQALAIQRRLAEANPAVTQFQNDLASSYHNSGVLRRATGHPEEALQSTEQALAIRRRLAEANPAVTQFQKDLAGCYNNIGLLKSESRHPAEALHSYEQALAIQQRLAEANPAVTQFQKDLASSHDNIGILQQATGHLEEALRSCEQALAIRRRLSEASPAVPDFQSDLGGTLHNIALIDIMEERWGAARDRLLEAVQHQRVALEGNPRHPTYRQFLHNHLASLARTMLSLRGPAEAARAAHELAALKADEPANLYNASCLVALCAPWLPVARKPPATPMRHSRC